MNATSTKALRNAITGALAASLLAGCAGGGARADRSATQAQTALAKGRAEKAIPYAESAVQAAPRDAAARATLAQAYLRSGRFASAATTFDDAMQLGDNSARTALGLALAYSGAGDNNAAIAVLDDWRDTIPVSDYGLALALAGDTSRGVALLADAIRGGDNTPKVRQNLAYAYALDGRWREARVMMSQDVPADQIDQRISDWAGTALPEDYQKRVATLLDVPVRADPGQPAVLALTNSPSAEQLAVEAAAQAPQVQEAPAVAVAAELPAQAEVAKPRVTLASFAPALAEPVAAPAAVTPARVAKPAAARVAASNGTHLVQLGSFSSLQGARRAWGILSARNPALRNYRMTITPAVVGGKNFWRVAAAGLNANSAGGLCSSVKNRGGACFAYAANRAPATKVPSREPLGVQLARRR